MSGSSKTGEQNRAQARKKKKYSDEWGTPPDIFAQLNEEFQFTLDPCATPGFAKCPKFYTKKDDGLTKSWKNERVFCNPPYSQIKKWINKAYLSSRDEGALVVLLIPARPDTRYWHAMVHGHKVLFAKGRIRFCLPTGKQMGSPNFASAVVIYYPDWADREEDIDKFRKATTISFNKIQQQNMHLN